MSDFLLRWGARIRYQAELFELYHTTRAAQLQWRKSLVQCASILSGLPAAGVLAQQLRNGATEYIALPLAAIAFFAAVLATLDQIFKFSEHYIEHRITAARYAEISKEIRSKPLTEADIRRFQAQLDGLSILEHKPLLQARCHNMLVSSYSIGNDFLVNTKVALNPAYWMFGTATLEAPRNLGLAEEIWVRKMPVTVAAS